MGKKRGKPAVPFTLTTQQRRALEKRLPQVTLTKISQRLLALLWLDDGRALDDVARLLRVVAKSVRRWCKLFRQHGLDGLCQLHYRGDPGTLTPAQVTHLKQEVQTGRFHCAAQVVTWLLDTYQLSLSLSGVKKLLQRCGCSFHKTSGFLFKADRNKQAAFMERHAQQKQAQAATTRRYFLDGVHLIWGMEMLFACWLLTGQRLEMGVGGGRKRWNILGAYCPDDQEYLDRRYTKENLTAQSVSDLLQLLCTKHPETTQFILYLDNARYQHAKVLKAWIATVQATHGVELVLEHLPAYSPNLNLIERLWKFLRKKALRKWYATFEGMQAAVADVLDNLGRYATELASLMTEHFRLVPEVPQAVLSEAGGRVVRSGGRGGERGIATRARQASAGGPAPGVVTPKVRGPGLRTHLPASGKRR